MAPPLLIASAENATIEELKQVSRLGSNQTALRCTAIQMLLAGASTDLVCSALIVTNRALRKWINRFNRCGVDGLIVKKRPGKMTIINDQQTLELTELIDQPQQAQPTFWSAKAFQAFLDEADKMVCFQTTTNIMIVDNATWQRRKSTNWQRWQPKYLPRRIGPGFKSHRAHLADDQSPLVQ